MTSGMVDVADFAASAAASRRSPTTADAVFGPDEAAAWTRGGGRARRARERARRDRRVGRTDHGRSAAGCAPGAPRIASPPGSQGHGKARRSRGAGDAGQDFYERARFWRVARGERAPVPGGPSHAPRARPGGEVRAESESPPRPRVRSELAAPSPNDKRARGRSGSWRHGEGILARPTQHSTTPSGETDGRRGEKSPDPRRAARTAAHSDAQAAVSERTPRAATGRRIPLPPHRARARSLDRALRVVLPRRPPPPDPRC